MYIKRRLQNSDFILDRAKYLFAFTDDELKFIKELDYSQSTDIIMEQLVSELNKGDVQFTSDSSIFKLKCDDCDNECESAICIRLEDDFGSEEHYCKSCVQQYLDELV